MTYTKSTLKSLNLAIFATKEYWADYLNRFASQGTELAVPGQTKTGTD